MGTVVAPLPSSLVLAPVLTLPAEGLPYAIEEMTERKLLVMNLR